MYTRMHHSRSGIISTTLCLTLTALAVITGNPAQAADSQPLPTRVVRFDDLNLSTTAGINKLYKRLQEASRAVCRAYLIPELALRAKRQACYDQAMSVAIARINMPTLTALYQRPKHDLS
jgi:UrcA family protein